MANRVKLVIQDRNGQIIAEFYDKAVNTILSAYENIDTEKDLSVLNAQINGALDELDFVSGEYARVAIPDQYARGLEEASKLLDFAGVTIAGPDAELHNTVVRNMASETALDFARNIQATREGARKAISQAERLKIRATLASDARTRAGIEQEIVDLFKSQGVQSLLDRGGKTWALDTYAKMLVVTKEREAFNTGAINRALELDIVVFRVTFTGSKHRECALWEDKLVSVSGQFGLPRLSDLSSRGLFHPNCRHRVVPDPAAQRQLEATTSEEAENPLDQYNVEDAKTSMIKRGLTNDQISEAITVLDEVARTGGVVDNAANVTVFHRTSAAAKQSILNTGQLKGTTENVFFSTKSSGLANKYGRAILKFKIPANMLKVSSIFPDEVHLRIPTLTKGGSIDLSKFVV